MFVWAILTLKLGQITDLKQLLKLLNSKFHDPAFVQIFESTQIKRMAKFQIIWNIKILKISNSFRANKIINIYDIFDSQVKNCQQVSRWVRVRTI